jgi:3-phenylpropionate/trans-cinnamate dioxygenase ferredoxin reductase subunit
MLAAPDSIVVLGGGQAGAWAAKTLRTEGYTGEISLIGDELDAPYERPALSKKVLAGTAQPESTLLLKPEALADLGVKWLPGVRATSIDRSTKRLALEDGRSLGYGKLLLCTGGRPLRPPIAGIDLERVFVLRTLADCRQIALALETAHSVCVIGGGWIGLEVASTVRELGKQVTLLENNSRLCERVLPPNVSEHLHGIHRAAGVDIRLGTRAEVIERTQRGLTIKDQAGNVITADLVVVGAGLIANDELAAKAGLLCARGVVVDSRCRTSDPDILAAGDVAISHNALAGELIRLESWQNATDQAVVAAKVALGADDRYDPLPWFWSDQHGTNVQIYGFPRKTQHVVTRWLDSAGSFLSFTLDRGSLVGVVGVNAPKQVRSARKLIQEQRVLREEDLADARVPLSAL